MPADVVERARLIAYGVGGAVRAPVEDLLVARRVRDAAAQPPRLDAAGLGPALPRDGAAAPLVRRAQQRLGGVTARAGNRRFRPLSALRAHTKTPYKNDLHRKKLRALNRPGGRGQMMKSTTRKPFSSVIAPATTRQTELSWRESRMNLKSRMM